MAYLTIQRSPADDDRWRWYHAPQARQVSLRPDNIGTIRAYLAFLSDVRGLDELGADDQALILRETFRDAGWATDRVPPRQPGRASPRRRGELTTHDHHHEAFARFEATMRL